MIYVVPTYRCLLNVSCPSSFLELNRISCFSVSQKLVFPLLLSTLLKRTIVLYNIVNFSQSEGCFDFQTSQIRPHVTNSCLCHLCETLHVFLAFGSFLLEAHLPSLATLWKSIYLFNPESLPSLVLTIDLLHCSILATRESEVYLVLLSYAQSLVQAQLTHYPAKSMNQPSESTTVDSTFFLSLIK